jgi:predicted nucleotidyltransferase
MSFDNKNYPNRKDHIKPYYGSKAFDRSCRNHGSCDWCHDNRTHSTKTRDPNLSSPVEEDYELYTESKRIDLILDKLDEIEQKENIIILFACESGSRSWGFESKNSDYDIRFIYVHDKDYYLSIQPENKRDVIEQNTVLDDGIVLDISGWDLKKFLSLMKKSNPTANEWLNSGIIYINRLWKGYTFKEWMLPEARKYYRPEASFYHYHHMAKGNFREFLMGETVLIKKYFYVIRPLFIINFIEQYPEELPPINLERLMFHVDVDVYIKDTILNLISRKKNGDELHRGPKIPVLSEYISMELNRLEGVHMDNPKEKKSETDTSSLDLLFRVFLE